MVLQVSSKHLSVLVSRDNAQIAHARGSEKQLLKYEFSACRALKSSALHLVIRLTQGLCQQCRFENDAKFIQSLQHEAPLPNALRPTGTQINAVSTNAKRCHHPIPVGLPLTGTSQHKQCKAKISQAENDATVEQDMD